MNRVNTVDTVNTDKPKVLGIDLETYSDVDLSKCGLYKYVEGDFHILLFAYAFDDEEVQIVDLACGEQIPQRVLDAIDDPEIIKAAWNAQFERTCIGHYLGRRLSPNSWRCSMVHAASLSLPLALKNAAKVLKTGEQKDRAGENLIKYFSVPCKPTKTNGGRTRNLPEHNPEGWQQFKDYCLQDVRTERDIRKRLEMFPMPDNEWDFYHMDQRINDRGVEIDTDLVEKAITCDLALSEEMSKRAYELTGLENPNSVSQLKGWLEGRGIPVETLGKKNVAAMIIDLDKNSCDQEALDMLKLRLQMAKSSVKKYQAAERCVCADSRARGLFQFYGANRTGRFSGRHIQLQNLPQNHISTLDEARELVKMGEYGMLQSIYGNVPDILSQLIRTMLVPKEGCEFIVADFSAIEARVLAWLAGENWRLDAFRNGEDIYCASASQMFGVPVVKHGVNGELRQKGKVAELACLAYNTPVLTDKGWVPIQYITKRHLVWDGLQWVEHDGVVFKGFRRIIHYDGLSATEDHLVFVENYARPIPFGNAVRKHLRLRKMERKGHSEAVYEGFGRVYDIRNTGPMHRFMTAGGLVHNCGYQGGSGALISMGALDMGLKESELPDIIEQWRNASPHIVQFWWDMERAAIETVKDHEEHSVGRVTFQFYGGALWMVLPSGRKLAYLKPRLQPNKFGRMSLTFEGTGNAAGSSGWSRQETYGGKLTENCIAEGTRILTNKGLVAIEKVTVHDRVWDGEAWVSHEGAINQGEKEVVLVGGLLMTAEHKILTEKGWIECGKAEGLNWADVSLPDGFEESGEYKTGENTMAVPMRVWERNRCSCWRPYKKKIPNKVMRMYGKAPDFGASKDTWNEQPSGVGGLALDETTVSGSKSSGVSQLWRAWHNCLCRVAGKLRAILGGYGSNLRTRIGFRSYRQQQRIQPGELPMGNEKRECQEQENEQDNRYPVWEDDGLCIGGTNRNRGNDSFVPPGPQLGDRITVCSTGRKEPVYDIRNCGPRHRFCVYDPRTGKLRIVSNCTQATARDILVEAMWRLEKAGFEIIGHVHDEVIIEAPAGKYTVDEVCKLMAQNPEWCPYCPLNAAGYLAPRYYFKD